MGDRRDLECKPRSSWQYWPGFRARILSLWRSPVDFCQLWRQPQIPGLAFWSRRKQDDQDEDNQMTQRPKTTRRVVLSAQAVGLPSHETFRVETAPLPDLSEGQVLTRTLYCSADPGTRSRLSSGTSYAPPLRIGDPIDGFAVGEVIESANPRFAVGEIVASGGGWAEHAIFGGRGYIQKIPHRRLPLSYWIGVLGVPGMTAWFGLKRVAALAAGERILVTSAAGPVGATAVQIARALGASRIIGTATTRPNTGGNSQTIYRDASGRLTGTAATQGTSSASSRTTYRDASGRIEGRADTSKVAGTGSSTQYRDASGRITGSQTISRSPSGSFAGTARDGSGRLTGSNTGNGKCQGATQVPVPPGTKK